AGRLFPQGTDPLAVAAAGGQPARQGVTRGAAAVAGGRGAGPAGGAGFAGPRGPAGGAPRYRPARGAGGGAGGGGEAAPRGAARGCPGGRGGARPRPRGGGPPPYRCAGRRGFAPSVVNAPTPWGGAGTAVTAPASNAEGRPGVRSSSAAWFAA